MRPPLYIFFTLLTIFALPAHAVKRDQLLCKEYLLHSSVEAQCGENCATYSFKNLLEGLIRRRLSSEYGLLAMAEAELSSRLEAFARRSFDPRKIGELPTDHRLVSSIEPLIYFTQNGVLEASDFPNSGDRYEFQEKFGMDLTSENINALYERNLSLFTSTIESAKRNDPAAEIQIIKFVNEAEALKVFVSQYREKGLKKWSRYFGQYSFEVGILANDKIPKSVSTYMENVVGRFLQNSKLVSISKLSLVDFKKRALTQLKNNGPFLLGENLVKGDPGHLLLAVGLVPLPEGPRIILRDSAPSPEDPTKGTFLEAQPSILGTDHYWLFVIPQEKNR